MFAANLMNQQPQAAAANPDPNGTLVVPASPLSTQGLAGTNLTLQNPYRTGVDQPPVGNAASGDPTAYCRTMVAIQQRRVQLDSRMTMQVTSPGPAMASNPFTFLANRLNQSFTNLGCTGLLHMKNPVTVTADGAGVVVAATFAHPIA
ncbi:hypothetical protein NGB36_32485 [Streptomyces sp. RB6PN25]|uniref:Uncharacterized protein n=1 Tax=Streptomyces humicola TaxID=2953240 RepID=A0ABT1Q5F4_9ACTN|nr:hypothetical protein [Streptomyces humicola]MCQ4085154.1 hypothetical protein [Streptomyces humicola]